MRKKLLAPEIQIAPIKLVNKPIVSKANGSNQYKNLAQHPTKLQNILKRLQRKDRKEMASLSEKAKKNTGYLRKLGPSAFTTQVGKEDFVKFLKDAQINIKSQSGGNPKRNTRKNKRISRNKRRSSKKR